MIENKIINLPVVDDLTTEYIEDYFKRNNLRVLRWAIVGTSEHSYVLNVSVIE